MGLRSVQKAAPKQAEKAASLLYEVIRPSKGEITKFEIRKGRDLKEIAGAIAKEQIVPEIVGDKMDWKNGIEKMTSIIKEDHPRLDKILERTPGTVDLVDITQRATKGLAERFKNAAELEDATKIVQELIIPEIMRHGDTSVPFKIANDIKSGMWQVGYDAVKPLKSRIARTIGHEIAEAIDDSANSKMVKILNKRMSLASDAIDVMQTSTGKVVKSGRIGQYFGGIVGSGVAGAINPLLAPLGYMAGKKATEVIAQRGTVGAAKKAGKLMQKAERFGAEVPMKNFSEAELATGPGAAGAEMVGKEDLSRFFKNKPDAARAEKYGFIDVEDDVLTKAGLERKLLEARETSGLDSMVRELEKKLQRGKELPKAPPATDGGVSGFTDLSTKTLDKMKGRTSVSKQFISDLTNAPELKQAERQALRNALEGEGDKIDVKKFADKVKAELLPLKRTSAGNVHRGLAELREAQRGNVAKYEEHVYQSPIKTSAGLKHFPKGTPREYFADEWKDEGGRVAYERYRTEAEKEFNSKNIENYFAHTRAEDMADGSTRRVIEAQSDLFQKRGLESEITSDSKLTPYRNTWHERIVREEVKQAAKDGKTKLQFPTGETAMKIEGLGDTSRWHSAGSNVQVTPENFKVGKEIYNYVGGGNRENKWVITEVLGNGKFKAVPKDTWRRRQIPGNERLDPRLEETFDISGKMDEDNPIFKFYEKEMGKFLKNKYAATRVTDKQGVSWYELNVKPEQGKLPVEAYAALPLGAGGAMSQKKE